MLSTTLLVVLLVAIFQVQSDSNEGFPCITNQNEIGECVPYYLCDDNSTTTDEATLITIRQAECLGILDVCCRINETDSSLVLSGCGRKNKNNATLNSYNESNTQFGEYPWMVAIFKITNNSLKYKETFMHAGVLIHPKVVLTIVHYVLSNQENYIARAGVWNLKSVIETIPHQDRVVQKIITHEDYNNVTLNNDIAILILQESFQITHSVNVICLPEGAIQHQKKCSVTAWGKGVFDLKDPIQDILRKIDFPIVAKNDCEESPRKTSLGRYFRLHNSFICAGGESDKDVCTGDGGSPLFCSISDESEQFEVVGLVSWGVGCGNAGIPGIYTNVAHLIPWINQKLKSNHIDMEKYKRNLQ